MATTKTSEYRKILKPKSPSNLKEKDIERAIDKVLKIGRDAGTGKFIAVKEAQSHKKTAVVETVRKSKPVRVVGSTIMRNSKSGKFVLVKETAKSGKTRTQATSKKK